MIGVYAQSEIEWTRTIRTTLGVRADAYQFDVTSDNPLNSGDGSDGLVSPKFGAAFGPWAATEFYVNAGMGFHSNDARGAVIRVDPSTGEPVDASRRSFARKVQRSACAPFVFAVFNPPRPSGTSASTRSCCSSAMPEPPKPAGRAAALVSNGPTTRASGPG